MKRKFAVMIAEAAAEATMDVELRAHYSGRGMYGEKTAALISSGMAEFAAAACLAATRVAGGHESEVEEFIDAIRAVRTDSMGRDSIAIY